jgi:hypothetical protein
MNKQQKETVKRINTAFNKLYKLDNINWTPHREILFKMNRDDEKKHRNISGLSSYRDAASVSDCAKLFTVHHIAESLLNPNQYTIKDTLHIRKSCIYAQALVNNYEDKIRAAWIDEDIEYLANLDYIELVNYELYKEQQEKRAA